MRVNKGLLTALVIAVCVLAVKMTSAPSFKGLLGPKPVHLESRVKGARNAKIKIVEFTDFQCPACSKVVPVVDKLLQKYDGKISLEHKHFPLPMHKHAMKASIYAECASEQGKFWSYHDVLFKSQTSWASLEDSSEYFEDLAMQLGLNVVKLKACVIGETVAKRIGSDKIDGDLAGVKATPTFVIDGKVFVGGVNLKAELESRLGK